MKDFLNKINKKYLVIFVFILFILLFILFTKDNQGIKIETTNSIKIEKKLSDKISIKQIDGNTFQLEYQISNYLDNNEYKSNPNPNPVVESVNVNFSGLKEISRNENKFIFRNSCRDEKKKYIILLDVSGSVVDKIGEDKYVNDLYYNLGKIFNTTNLALGDEIYVGFIGENESRSSTYEFIGPTFTGISKENSVKHQKTFTIENLEFSENKNIATCSEKNIIATSTRTIINRIEIDYKKIRSEKAQNTFIGDSLNLIKSDLELNNYKKVVYILFTDGLDNSTYKNDTNFRDCNSINCGYNFIKQTDEDEAYVFWSDKTSESRFKNLFNGIKLTIN